MNGLAVLGLLLTPVVAIVVAVGSNLATKEAEGWIDLVPGALLRLARRRLPENYRDELYDEWSAELD